MKNQPGADATTCTANEFLGCDGTVARSCNAAGNGATTQDCGAAGCNADAKRCNQCAPNTASCGNNTVDHCGPDGLPAGQDACAVGCVDAPAAHCAYLEPRYLPDVCDTPAATPDLTISGSATFDTGLDTNCTGGVVAQTGGPAICVVRYGAIAIKSLTTVTVVGSRALALVADTSLSIDGVLDVSASGTTSGPGGGSPASGGQAGSTSGGGGAGFRTAGGAGGNATADGGAANAGAASTDPSLLTVLVGGPRPSNGSIITVGGATSGGGGGAATLIACRGSVAVAGVIDAGGGGGNAGCDTIAGSQISFNAGAGGGAGGNVVLQGLAVSVTGQVYANGGGGGAGSNTNDACGRAGGNGLQSTSPASGGTSTAGEGIGGNGGAAGGAPKPGGHPTAGSPGGGGGSMGFFQTYTPMDVTPALTPSAASPGFSANKNVKTR